MRRLRRATLVLAALPLLTYAAALWWLRPRSPLFWDEVLFLGALDEYDIARHLPHPPGYPLYVAVGRAARWMLGEPLLALQAVSLLGSVSALIGLAWMLRRECATWTVAALAAGFQAAMPTFLFHSTVALADIAATAGVIVTVALASLDLQGEAEGWSLAAAAAAGAAAISIRPQVMPALLGAAVWCLVAGVRCGRSRRVLGAAAAAAAILAACWVPAITATGWSRFVEVLRAQNAWVAVVDRPDMLPQAELDWVVRGWLKRPLGSSFFARIFGLLAVLGGLAWWQRGRRRLVVLCALAGGGYLAVAPWLMATTHAVRYALPALPFAAALAAGIATPERRWLRHMGTASGWILVALMAAWPFQALRLRSSEPAPVAAALDWVREHVDPRRSVVLASDDIYPQARYALAPHGFLVNPRLDRRLLRRIRRGDIGSVAEVISPAPPIGPAVRFERRWIEARLAAFTPRDRLSCAVIASKAASLLSRLEPTPRAARLLRRSAEGRSRVKRLASHRAHCRTPCQ